jgi:hypothetical protein
VIARLQADYPTTGRSLKTDGGNFAPFSQNGEIGKAESRNANHGRRAPISTFCFPGGCLQKQSARLGSGWQAVCPGAAPEVERKSKGKRKKAKKVCRAQPGASAL